MDTGVATAENAKTPTTDKIVTTEEIHTKETEDVHNRKKEDMDEEMHTEEKEVLDEEMHTEEINENTDSSDAIQQSPLEKRAKKKGQSSSFEKIEKVVDDLFYGKGPTVQLIQEIDTSEEEGVTKVEFYHRDLSQVGKSLLWSEETETASETNHNSQVTMESQDTLITPGQIQTTDQVLVTQNTPDSKKSLPDKSLRDFKESEAKRGTVRGREISTDDETLEKQSKAQSIESVKDKREPKKAKPQKGCKEKEQ